MQHHPRTHRRKRRHALAAGLLLCALPVGAQAAGLSAPGVGDGPSSPEHIAPSSVYWNPGALGMIERPRMTLGVNIIVGSIRYQRNYRGIYRAKIASTLKTPYPPKISNQTKAARQ